MNHTSVRLTKMAAATALIGASWCAHAADPLADEKIAVAKSSIQRAEQAGAPQEAPVDLATARDKLAQAEKAKASRDNKQATMLAEQADIDAQVAEATARQHVSHKAAADFDASMQALRAESMRATQPTQ